MIKMKRSSLTNNTQDVHFIQVLSFCGKNQELFRLK